MTNGIGNPDWQRRYVFSAAPIQNLSINTAVQTFQVVTDANGYQYLLLSAATFSSTATTRVQVRWSVDSAGSTILGVTDFVILPNAFQVLKVPVMTRYYQIETTLVSASGSGTMSLIIYGTNADQDDLLTQSTAIPMAAINASLGANVSQQVVMGGMYGGRVFATFNHAGNNKWTGWFEYYDWSAQAWIIFYNVRGLDKGQSWSEQVWLPYAPVRCNMRNDDTVAQITQLYVITANTP